MGGAELISKTQVTLWVAMRVNQILKTQQVERGELIIEIQIRRKLMLSVALPATTPWMRRNAYNTIIERPVGEQQKTATRLHITLSLALPQTALGKETEKA